VLGVREEVAPAWVVTVRVRQRRKEIQQGVRGAKGACEVGIRMGEKRGKC
jgi:hypothetical protein